MNCRNCIHYELCFDDNITQFDNGGAEECTYFKDESKFIELPCKVNEICAIRRKNSIGREVHERAALKGIAIIVHNECGKMYMSPENVMTIEATRNIEEE